MPSTSVVSLAIFVAVGAPACGSDRSAQDREEATKLGDVAPREDRGRGAAIDTAEAARESRALAARVEPGTTFRVRLNADLGMHRVETDSFTATTVEALRAGEAVAVPAGTPVRGTVTAMQEMEGEGRPGILKLDFREIELGGERIPLYAVVVAVDSELRVEREGGAAAAGDADSRALLGRVLTEADSGLMEKAVGAASGTAIVLAVPGAGAVLPVGSEITLRLEAELGGG